ncbi:alpha/beta hydrolase family protein [Kangiella sediminilitoris]|uniref:Peptidase S9 prolyl oligopeptidase active site domain protein n=1 Tax=Kangiella sediminilitoris TaxID=1144748 RepID=A0A1B3B9G0_9GAMM|nr:S9 family peptidase [Kangiella sediminilitoris]AOE49386.1 Peptidase S9 prolyl oligopeptidase active site domain protein [Kangiella sediminilitoris]
MNKQQKKVKPYGLWESPISAEQLASKSTRLGQIQTTSDALYWLEGRPEEQGRGVIVRYREGQREDITPKPYNVRTRVHEYGGADFWLNDDVLLFVDDEEQQLYKQDLQSLEVIAITPKPPSKRSWRYNDGCIAPQGDFTVCVRERHEKGEVVNELVKIPLDGSASPSIIAEGYDFYSNPRISSDGKRISWLCWNHPNMPWDETEVWSGEWVNGEVANPKAVVAENNVSAYQPDWSDNNELLFAADYEEWWHLYQQNSSKPLHVFQHIEFALPQWVFGCNTWQQLDEDTLIAIGTKTGTQALYLINLSDGSISLLTDHWTAFNGQMVVRHTEQGNQVYFVAANPTQPECVIEVTLDGDHNILQREILSDLEQTTDRGDISVAQHVSFKTSHGDKAHGFFYPPVNSGFEGPGDERPPLIVMSHGGPTAMADSGLDSKIQFWTSRGFAVADVNYRGSTGYGRLFRDKLRGQWGLLDVDDCIAMGHYLAEQGLVDGERMAIRGGSAGGYTTLCALTFHDAFKAGMSRYGVADLVSLSQDSHKFEIRYLDSMVGPYPEKADIYQQRSPVNHTDQLSCPILILQGLEDKVVPPNQAEAMVDALKAKGLPYEYITFEGEGHGFRKPDTIIKAFNTELHFYQQYLL